MEFVICILSRYLKERNRRNLTMPWYVKTDKEVQEKWTELNDMKVTAYISIGLILEGRSFRHPLATGGWLYDMAQRLPPNMVPRSVSGNGFIDRLPDRRP